ncbi:MAG: hypothetical protein HQK53_20105, partial [Oligoflexia bacterium]|nr:hypothetical protein [Oligoflexia bacterium]
NLIENEKQLVGLQTEKSIIETNVEKRKFERDELTLTLEEQQRDYNEIAKELALNEERLNYLHKGREERIKLLSDRKKENQELIDDITERGERFTFFSKELEQLSDKFKNKESLEENLEILNDSVSGISDNIENLKEEIDGLEKE